MYSMDPDVRRHDQEDELRPCPECHNWLMPLDGFEIESISESPSADAEPWEFFLYGWWAPVYNYVYDIFTIKSRKRTLAQLKAATLPQFPRSLVCPRCLHVMKRP